MDMGMVQLWFDGYDLGSCLFIRRYWRDRLISLLSCSLSSSLLMVTGELLDRRANVKKFLFLY